MSLPAASVLADGPEAANDRALLFSDANYTAPRDADDARRTAPLRAAAILRFAACRPQTSDGPGDRYRGAFNSDFSDTLEAWGRDALAKLAYDGDCPTDTAAERYHAVDVALSQLSIASDLRLGTDAHDTYGPQRVDRRGDLDTGLKELIPIAYLYKNRIPLSFGHLLDLFDAHLSTASGDSILGSPPYWLQDIQVGAQVGHAEIAETENHTLLELSEQYLSNQLLLRNRGPAVKYNLRPVHDYLMRIMKGIITSDFFEYNSKPYQHFALYAMENLADFARDRDISTAARIVLDVAGAKFATASSLLRRSSPYRRRGSHDGDLFTGSEADEQFCRFLYYTGQLQTLGGADGYSASSGCMSAMREVIGTYAPPRAVIDIAINKSTPYVQTFVGGINYFGQLWGSQVEDRVSPHGSTELYDNEGPFLIAGGGRAENNGLPAIISGALPVFVLDQAGIPKSNYSHSDDDVGVALPILLIPYDAPNNAAPANSRRPVVDRTELVRIQGVGHADENLCVTRNFACGKNPIMPGHSGDGWTFDILPSVRERTFVAMLSITDPFDGYRVGLFEAEPEGKFANFSAFQAQVKKNNPLGTRLFHHEGLQCPFYSWEGRYKRIDGALLDFRIPPPLRDPNSLSRPCRAPNVAYWGLYPIGSPNTQLTKPTFTTLAQGPLSGDRTGRITITSPNTGEACVLDISNIAFPRRSSGCNNSFRPSPKAYFPAEQILLH